MNAADRTSSGDIEGPHPEVAERRRRRCFWAASLVPVVVGVVVLGVAQVDRWRTQADEPRASGTWTAIPSGPLSPRSGAPAYWTGRSVIVVGGYETPVCPPGGDCVPPPELPQRDGARFDPRSGVWARIADAPVPIGDDTQGAVAGDRLYLWVPGPPQRPGAPPTMLAFHLRDGRWEQLTSPPTGGEAWSLRLVALGDQVFAYHVTVEETMVVFDPDAGRWEELPPDPLGPSGDRSLVSTGREMVLLETAPNRRGDTDDPGVLHAAVLDTGTRSWQRLADEQALGGPLFGAGGRVVRVAIVPPPRGLAGALGVSASRGSMLDPATGTWEALTHTPTEPGPTQGLSAVGTDRIVLPQGYLLDVPENHWTVVPPYPTGVPYAPSTVWADDRLVVWGGYLGAGRDQQLLGEGWAWKP